MSNEQQSPKPFKKDIARHGTFVRCPLCHVPYTPDEFDVIEVSLRGMLFLVRCRSCRHSLFGSFFFSEQGLGSVGMLTDFTKEDIVHFRRRDPISADDVLRVYEQWR